MLEFLLEAFGEVLFEGLCHLGGACIQELLRLTRDVL